MTLWDKFHSTVERLFRWFGTEPDWQTITNPTGAPSGEDGVDLAGAIKTLVHVPLRKQADGRTARTFIGYDAGTTYRVIVDGHEVDTAAGADEQATLEQMRDDINADGNAGEIVTAAVEDGELVTVGDGDEDYNFDVEIVSGDGTIEATVDPTGATVYVWLRRETPDGDDSDGWYCPPSLVFEDVDRRGFGERITTSGHQRCYVEVVAEEPGGETVQARQDLIAAIGPGVME